MGKHRAQRLKRLNVLTASLLAMFTVSATLLVTSLSASAATDPVISPGVAQCTNEGSDYFWKVTWQVDAVEAGGTWLAINTPGSDFAPYGPGGAALPIGQTVSTTSITVIAEYATTATSATLNVTVRYPDPDPEEPDVPDDRQDSDTVTISGTCQAPPPTAPTTINASNVTQTSVNLSWSGATGSITGYKLFRCSGAGCDPTTQIGGTITGTSYQNTGLSPNTIYRYRVKATGPGGDSPMSTYTREIATPAQPPPTTETTSAPPTTEPPVTATASPTETVAPVGGLPTSGTGARTVASNESDSGPSLLLVGSTAGILVAFVVALVFLLRERRLLKQEVAEGYDDDDYGGGRGYWGDYHTQLR